MAFAAPLVVNGPVREALSYGLLSVLTPRGGDQHWENGVEWEPLTCGPASGIGDPDCEPSAEGGTVATGLPKGFPSEGDGAASAFSVYGSYQCSPIGRTLQEAQDRATEHLLAREEARVEQALWTGDLGNTPNLTDGATDLSGGTPVAPVVALALLENFIAQEYGSQGVIHVSRGGAIVLAQAGQFTTSGGVLRTLLGTPVVAGAGYPDTGSPTSGVAAASPALLGYRSEVFVPSARAGDLLDRGLNNLFAVAERKYLIGWDPCGTATAEFNLECC